MAIATARLCSDRRNTRRLRRMAGPSATNVVARSKSLCDSDGVYLQPDNFSIELSQIDGRLRLELVGELDMAQTSKLEGVVDDDAAIAEIVVDTSGLTFIDSKGLAALLEMRERFGRARFTLIEGRVTAKLLDISGLRDHLD